MTNLIEKLISIKGVKTSSLRTKILILLCDNKELTISQIQEKLVKQGDKYNYRSIWQHIQYMKDGIIEMVKKEHEAGKPVHVRLIDIIRKDKKILPQFRSSLVKSINKNQGKFI